MKTKQAYWKEVETYLPWHLEFSNDATASYTTKSGAYLIITKAHRDDLIAALKGSVRAKRGLQACLKLLKEVFSQNTINPGHYLAKEYEFLKKRYTR